MVDERQRLSAFQVAAAYIGTVVGAGFASGQEVLQFFTFFGAVKGLMAVVLSGVLLAFYGAAIPFLAHRFDAVSHGPLLRAAGGPLLARLLDGLILIFLMGTLSTMIAGFGAALYEQLDWPLPAGRLALAAVALLTVLLGLGGVVTAFTAVAPFLMLAIGVIALATLAQGPGQAFPAQPGATAVPWWPLSAVVYVSYNLVLGVAVLAPLGRRAHPRTLIWGGAGGGAVLGLALLLIHLALLAMPVHDLSREIPMAPAAQRLSPLAGWIFLALLLASIYTTAVGALYGLKARWGGDGGWQAAAVPVAATLVALWASQVGFSRLVGRLYSLVGVGGILLMVLIAGSLLATRRAGSN